MVTVAGYMYTVRFGGLIRSETFVPPSSPSSQKLLSNPNPSPLPTRSRRRRHRHRLPLELVKPEPPPSSQARGASGYRRCLPIDFLRVRCPTVAAISVSFPIPRRLWFLQDLCPHRAPTSTRPADIFGSTNERITYVCHVC
uniref:Uncharacterized protein n=1 Tax=Oryza nivara TaxID=4536 RepID=A0A0E0HN30_ORYNI